MSSCEILLKTSEVDDLRSTCITGCVLNSFLSYAAIMLNVVTIHAIKKTSSLPKTLKTLLLSLAFSDVGVGLFVQPFYTSLVVRFLQHNIPDCITYRAFDVVSHVFSGASFFGVVAISVDRFLAVHLHLRYQELVTHKRVVAVVISLWVLSAFLSFMILWIRAEIRYFSVTIIGVACVLLTKITFIKIYLTARRHKIQIQSLQVQRVEQVQQIGEIAHFAGLVKSAVCIFYVYLVFLICYVPFVIYLVAVTISGPSIALKRLNLLSSVFMFLNSSLNPVIYCWKMRHIRHAIMDILRNMSCNGNQTSH